MGDCPFMCPADVANLNRSRRLQLTDTPGEALRQFPVPEAPELLHSLLPLEPVQDVSPEVEGGLRLILVQDLYRVAGMDKDILVYRDVHEGDVYIADGAVSKIDLREGPLNLEDFTGNCEAHLVTSSFSSIKSVVTKVPG